RVHWLCPRLERIIVHQTTTGGTSAHDTSSDGSLGDVFEHLPLHHASHHRTCGRRPPEGESHRLHDAREPFVRQLFWSAALRAWWTLSSMPWRKEANRSSVRRRAHV